MTETLFDLQKPPYRVASMQARRSRPRNRRTAVSTFSGMGGSSLGLWSAGWRIPYAVEFVPIAAETYSRNFPDTFVDTRDIRKITGAQVLSRIGLEEGELDLFEGSPPCSSFSGLNKSKAAQYGGMKVKAYSEGIKQATDDLFGEWVRLVGEIRPKAVIAENVIGLGTTQTGADLVDDDGMMSHVVKENVLEQIVTAPLEELGYNVAIYPKVNAHWYGAATIRTRLYVVGYRGDIGRVPGMPRESPYRYTLRDALDAAPWDTTSMDPDLWEYVGRPTYAAAALWGGLQPGKSPKDTGFQMTRCSWDRPVSAFTASAARTFYGPLHPDVCRRFTPREMKLLSGIPDDFILEGDYRQQAERVGRAVVPDVYEAYGKMIADDLDAAGVPCAA